MMVIWWELESEPAPECWLVSALVNALPADSGLIIGPGRIKDVVGECWSVAATRDGPSELTNQ